MSQCSQNTAEFIKSTFGPKVAVVSSDAAERVSLQNGLSVVELLKPFSHLNAELQIRDPTNTPHVIKGLHLSFSDPFKPPESSQVFRKLINDDISNNFTPGNVAVNIRGYQVKQSCPWYEMFRELYFQYFRSAEHDSIMHYLACIIFVSAEEADPVAQFAALRDEVEKSPVRWVDNDRLIYQVLVQDLSVKGKTPVEDIMQSLTTQYGPATCHLLKLHQKRGSESEPPGPNPWRQFAKERGGGASDNVDSKALTLLQMAIDDVEDDPLGANSPEPNPMLPAASGKICGEKLTIADQAAIRSCINDFVVRGLLPFNERRMRALNEALNTRRGLRGTFFSATKKLFSAGPKPGVGGKMTTNPGYLTDSPEILLRRLGDISFLLQHYTMAYSSYHNVKRDFQNDQAYNHYAAALEMTSLSLFMGTGVRREPHPYYDECINVYMNLCKSPLYAMRATLVHCECLISRGYFLSASSWFIKMTNDEADLNSGLLLEQGAHCYVRMDPPSLRKYAFHLVLAGHRYSKAAQRKHALRCYRNACDIFKGKGWSLAENHIGFTIGRHSFNVRDIEGAYTAYKELLTFDERNVHVMHSQVLFQKGIQDFVSVVQLYLQSQPPGTSVDLPIPVVGHSKIHVSLLGHKFGGLVKELPHQDKEKRAKVVMLEEHAHGIITSESKMLSFFKPYQIVFSGSTINTQRPTCAINETVSVLIPVKNPLQIPITLSNLSLQCLHSPARDPVSQTVRAAVSTPGSSPDLGRQQSTATRDQVERSILEQLVLGPEEEVVISLSITPLVEGNLTIASMNYHLVSTKSLNDKDEAKDAMENMIPGKISLCPQGPRLNATKEQRVMEMYGTDNRLNLLVTSPLPTLSVDTSSLPSHMFCGEVKCAVIQATNTGSTPLTSLCLATSHPHTLAVGEVKLEPFQPVVHPVGGQYCSVVDPTPSAHPATLLNLPGGQLNPGQTAYIALWVYGGDEAQTYDLLTVFYYTPLSTVPGVTHRAVSAETKVNVNVSVTLETRVCDIRPTAHNTLQMVGSVVVNNVGYYSLSLQDLHVTQMSLISDRWILQPLESSIPLVAYPGASINIPFQAELSARNSSYLSSVGLRGPLIDCSEDHILDLYRRSPVCKRVTPDTQDTYKMGLVVFWEGSIPDSSGGSRVLHAQNHAYVEAALRPAPSQLLCLGLSYQECWSTDFKATPLLSVNVTLHITNCHDSQLEVVVTAKTTAGSGDKKTITKSSSDTTLPFIWSGMVKHRLELPEQTTKSVDLTAVFSQPGVYDINQVAVVVLRNSEEVPQVLNSTSLLRVDSL